MSPQRVTQQVDLWKKELPTVKPFYAVKSNPDPHLLHHLYDAGLGFDCASKRELLSIEELCRPHEPSSERILYANPCKSEHDIRAAEDMGSPPTVVDSIEELSKVEKYAGGVYIRIAVDDCGSAMPFSSKFGYNAKNILHIGETARSLDIAIHGISFHVGSGCLNGSAYKHAIFSAYNCIRTLSDNIPYTLPHTIDIGGGFLAYAPDFRNKALHIRETMIRVNKQELAERREAIRFVAEPGRFFSSNSFDFFVQIIGKKESTHGWSYTIDDSIYGQFSSILFDQATPVWFRVRGDDEAPRDRSKGVIFGRTCDSVDVIVRAESMEELEVGDWLWFPYMGAYTRATATEFNGFPRPEVFVDDEVADLSHVRFLEAMPRGLEYMAPVTAKSFWA